MNIYFREGYGQSKKVGYVTSKAALLEVCQSMRTYHAIAITKRSTIAAMLTATNDSCYRITRREYLADPDKY